MRAERMGQVERAGRETAQTEDGVNFFNQLASHWKKHLQRLERLDAHPRPEAARQDAPEGIAPHAACGTAPSNAGLFRFDMVKGAVKPRKDAPRTASVQGSSA